MNSHHNRTPSLVLVALIGMCSASCGQTAIPPTPTATNKAESAGEVRWIDPKDIQPRPIQRDSLSDEQLARVRALQSIFVEVDGQSVDQWVDNFKRDLNPDRELAIWEKMAGAYTSYCTKRDLPVESKKEVYKVVLLRSMASEDDVLKRLELKILSKDDAVEITKGF